MPASSVSTFDEIFLNAEQPCGNSPEGGKWNLYEYTKTCDTHMHTHTHIHTHTHMHKLKTQTLIMLVTTNLLQTVWSEICKYSENWPNVILVTMSDQWQNNDITTWDKPSAIHHVAANVMMYLESGPNLWQQVIDIWRLLNDPTQHQELFVMIYDDQVWNAFHILISYIMLIFR